MAADREQDGREDPQTYAIIGAAMEVHSVLGNGFLEGVYQEALGLELSLRQIPFMREMFLPVHYKAQLLTCRYEADFICYGEIIVEIKALDALHPTHHAQVINYLKATGFHRALLINFGADRLQYKRFVLGRKLSTDDADGRR